MRQAGTSRLDGTTVTQYTGSYRLPAAVNALPTAARAVVEREQVTDGYLPIVTFSAWLDRSQQLRKLVVREQFQGANAIGQKAVIETQTSTIEVTSLNQAVTITIPPAAQISAVPRSAIGSP